MKTEQPAPAPPPLPPPPPPPAPSGLSAMQASLTNFLGKGLSASKVSPRRPAAAVNFVHKHRPAVRDLQRMGLARAMRTLDSVRKHTATASECDALGASGRLDVQDRAGLLVLCGCQRGCRFTSDEMNTVQRVTHGMAKVFALLELQFTTLAPKIRGNVSEQAHEQQQRELEEFCGTADTWLALFDEAQALAREKQEELRLGRASFAGAPGGGAAGSPRQGERLPPFPTWLSTLMERYHSEQKRRLESNAQAATGASSQLPRPASGPLASQQTEGCSASESTHYVDVDCGNEPNPPVQDSFPGTGITVAKDDETADWSGPADAAATAAAAEAAGTRGNIDHPQAGATSSRTPAEGKVDGPAPPPLPTASAAEPAEDVYSDSAAVDSFAKFCRFLALLVASVQEEGPASTTGSERAALAELVRASDDGSDRAEFGFSSESGNNKGADTDTGGHTDDAPLAAAAATGPSSPPVRSPGSPKPLRYWALRIHRFMLSVRELRAVPGRDLGALEAAMSEVRRGCGRRGKARSPSPSAPGK